MAALLIEYYLPTFFRLHQTYSQLIKNRLLAEPLKIRANAIKRHAGETRLIPPEEAHDVFARILTEIEGQLREVIKSHSCFYWIHLYRRIGLHLSDQHDSNTDPMTLAWVRSLGEQAIFKYGRLQGRQDIDLANRVSPNKILGGEFLKTLHRSGYPPREQELFLRTVCGSPQWVLTDFRASDLATIYFIEGLSYQYWYLNTKQRAAGKGISIKVNAAKLDELRSDEAQTLLENYDERIESFQDGMPSNVGTYVCSPATGDFEKKAVLLCLVPNVGRIPMPEIAGIEHIDPVTKQPVVLNYVVAPLDLDRYYGEHCYLEKAFYKKHGFGLKEFCLTAYALGRVILRTVSASETSENAAEVQQINMLKRGYLSPGIGVSQLKLDALNFLKNTWLQPIFDRHNVEQEIDLIFSFLTLDQSKQESLGLWSLGPRFIIIPYQDNFFYDASAWIQIFKNLFFGLRSYDPKNKKGPGFEAAFADLARANNLEVVVQSKELVVGQSPREIDVAIRSGNCLILCECRASERPLNFEIGDPRTISKRGEDFQGKVDQVLSLSELLRQHPKGASYDFGWAQEVVGVVVSPYIEWIWSLEEQLWVSKQPLIPRILSAPEAIFYIKSLSCDATSAAAETT